MQVLVINCKVAQCCQYCQMLANRVQEETRIKFGLEYLGIFLNNINPHFLPSYLGEEAGKNKV